MKYESHYDELDWTDHPDAYPDLTHCPSCGETVSDEGRCDGCDRDLRLPQ